MKIFTFRRTIKKLLSADIQAETELEARAFVLTWEDRDWEIVSEDYSDPVVISEV